MKSHLVKWAEDYAAKGLVIIDVDNGQFDKKDALQEESKDLPFRVLWDEGGQLAKEYGIRGYPSAFLIGVDGNVVWEGFPLPNVEAIDAKIQEELAKVPEDKRGDPAPDDWKASKE